jgi:DNA-directed RNA polymerase subunit M/transcription elongation factor TFIIS
MKVIWSSKQEFNECPRCDSVMVEAGKKMICPTCGIKEIERLQKLVKRLTKRAPDVKPRRAVKAKTRKASRG